jgi:flagellar motor switch protein FliM
MSAEDGDRGESSNLTARLPAGGAPTREVAGVLAAAPVEIVAEVARVALRGDELLSLCRGSVLALGTRRLDEIELRVGGRIWAKGELVAIESQLGVRITSVLG